MSVNLSPVGGAGAQFCDNNGNPLNGGKLYTYSAGTTTPAATYTSAAGSVFHPNPIVLNAGGRVPDSGEIWLSDNISYKFVLKTSADVLIATWDNINGINSNFVNYTIQEEVITATAGQTVFNLSTITYAPATNSLAVYVDGVNQIVTDAYVETDANTVTFVSGLHVGALVKFTTAVPATGTATNAAVVTYDPAGTGAVPTTVQAKLRETVSVKDFGAVGDGVTDDTAAIQAAVDALSENQTLVFSGLFKTNGVITISTSRIGIHFDDARFYVGDTGADGTTVNGAVGKIGYHFKQVTKVQVSGSAEFIGTGTSGVTSLLGVMFDTCTDLSCPAFMRFETMAIGRSMKNCIRSNFGNVIANDMNGLQPFESPPTNNAGSVEVVTGCTYCQFGDAIAYNNEKPARYLSVGTGSNDNVACAFGSTICDGVDVSPTTAEALQIRSAVDCSFGPVIGNGLQAAVYIAQYNTDAAYSVNRVYIESITGAYPSTAASLDALLEMSTSSSNALGSVTIGSIDADCSGEHGIFFTSGKLIINSLKIKGSAGRLITTSNSSGTGDVTLSIGTLVIDGHTSGNETIRIGRGASVSIGHIDVTKGVGTTGIPLARYFSSVGTGAFNGMSVESLKYQQGGATNDYSYFFYDDSGANPFTAWYVGNVYGEATTAHLFCDSRDFWVRRGNYFTASLTSLAATYAVGTILWDSNAAAGAPPGWYCVTAGAPGTWKAMANLAV